MIAGFLGHQGHSKIHCEVAGSSYTTWKQRKRWSGGRGKGEEVQEKEKGKGRERRIGREVYVG